ncbi:hypothetical protein CL614_01410 [archaeon]|nr:hypothetical protein [archaeon]|tara:strand:- start:982 stop:1737 length:756 start_codon:yes stop_codon:yes gene_type:complete
MIKPNKEIAEICGIHAGDGYLRNDGKRVELDLSGSLEEKIYYDNHVIPLFSNEFKVKIQPKWFKSRNTYGFVIRNIGIVTYIHELGFPYGKKSLYLKAPNFILKSKNPDLKIYFLRGLLDTDGCITFDRRYDKRYSNFKQKYHTYPRLTLSTISESLCLDIQKLLIQLKINFWIQTYQPKNKNEKTKYITWIRGKNFEKWMKIISSKNPTKYSRYKIWKIHGFCPANTTFKQRCNILTGEIKPRKMYEPVA